MKRLLIGLGCILAGVVAGAIADALQDADVVSAAGIVAGMTAAVLYHWLEGRAACAGMLQ